jgi:hypothetical protein
MNKINQNAMAGKFPWPGSGGSSDPAEIDFWITPEECYSTECALKEALFHGSVIQYREVAANQALFFYFPLIRKATVGKSVLVRGYWTTPNLVAVNTTFKIQTYSMSDHVHFQTVSWLPDGDPNQAILTGNILSGDGELVVSNSAPLKFRPLIQNGADFVNNRIKCTATDATVWLLGLYIQIN